MPNLLDLIGFGLVPLGLKVQDFVNTVLPEDVVASADAHAKAQSQQKPLQVRKCDIRVGGPPANLLKCLAASGHVKSPLKGRHA
jgi:hypothetical protein